MVTRTLAVRARVEAGDDPRFDRVRDPLTAALLRGDPAVTGRYATHWGDRDALLRLAEAKRLPLDPSLAAALRGMHERLGAPASSLAALDRLARGEAVAVVAGQQPAPLGGPLFSLHKTVAAIALARRVEERTGVPCVALYWMHGEDSDFDEIRGTTIADASLALHDLALPDALRRDGGLIGSLPLPPVAALDEQAVALWQGLPHVGDADALMRRARSAARDLGEYQSALLLALLGDAGLVVVDPRLPAFRAAARPWIDRYLERPDAFADAARRAGDALEATIGRRPLAGPALESFVFVIEDGTRRKVTPAEARALPAGVDLVASVALRPVIQDAVLPTVGMACGPGELAYLAQLREVFELLGVRAACPVPRFGATWLPGPAVDLIERSDADPWEVVTASDAVLRRLSEARVPAAVRTTLERAREASRASLDGVAQSSAALDPSLPQMVESARGKIDYQFARLLEGYLAKARHQLDREHPEWLRVRYYLAPGDKLQERRLAMLEPFVHRGPGVVSELLEYADEHAAALEQGRSLHFLLEL
jgi:uncharacterized protein YllA (UPF0747 family)